MSSHQPKRSSRYQKPPKKDLEPLKRTASHIQTMELFAPRNFTKLTAPMIALHIDRSLGRTQHILQELWHHDYLLRMHPPQNPLKGGSSMPYYVLDREGAKFLSLHLDEKIKAPNINPLGIQPQLEHTLLVNQFATIIIAACRKTPGIDLSYRYVDRQFTYPIKIDGEPENMVPDNTLGIQRHNEAPRHFFVEVQRSTRATKEPDYTKEQKKSINRKFQRYYLFYKNAEWRKFPTPEYPEMKNLRNTRLLIITDTSDQEHENLIDSARSIDEARQGLRFFWFIKASQLDLEHPEKIFDHIWQTPVVGDPLKSIIK